MTTMGNAANGTLFRGANGRLRLRPLERRENQRHDVLAFGVAL